MKAANGFDRRSKHAGDVRDAVLDLFFRGERIAEFDVKRGCDFLGIQFMEAEYLEYGYAGGDISAKSARSGDRRERQSNT